MLQAFIDESIDRDGTLVLAGYVASAEAWASFSAEWKKLLPRFGTLSDGGYYHFKMAEMAMTPERMERVEVFYRVIEDHVLGILSVKVNIHDLNSALDRIVVPNVVVNWEDWRNPYFLAFRFLMDAFHTRRHKMTELIPMADKVDFYFDDKVEKKIILSMWDNYMKHREPEVVDLYGATPRFEKDQDFLPLQAADFWAWWVRKWHAEGSREKVRAGDFGTFKARKATKYQRLDGNYTEDLIVEELVNIAQGHLPPGQEIIVFPKE